MKTWRYCDVQRCHVASAGELHSQVKGDQISDMTDIVISLAKNEHR
jgi:hypothetical protein